MKYIRVFESYQSQKDLENLTRAICYKIGEDTYDNFIDMNFDKIDFFVYVELNEFNPNDYGILNEFIKEYGDMIIGMVSKEDVENRNGIYLSDNGEGKRYIYLLEKKDVLKMFNTILKVDKDDETIRKKFKNLIYANYKNDLIHELQHAYDDFRSNGKYHDTPEDYYERRNKAISLSKKKKLKKEELDFIEKQNIEYLNLRYEIDARFTSAINDINFYEITDSSELKIYPFTKILKDFKYAMGSSIFYLNDDEKKRIFKKLGQFYEIEKEFVKKKNNEIK